MDGQWSDGVDDKTYEFCEIRVLRVLELIGDTAREHKLIDVRSLVPKVVQELIVRHSMAHTSSLNAGPNGYVR